MNNSDAVARVVAALVAKADKVEGDQIDVKLHFGRGAVPLQTLVQRVQRALGA